ncbi:hypothetical protein CMV_005205 [Castanea mollissima]|uniref:Uncharacterized protein n=1 Tax=Castanea mollissima TaxID=60419 RepID=A0A8J4RXH1_9ROSI|nr:hypothetical protein CMV_005205 [Castanea mollissima]
MVAGAALRQSLIAGAALRQKLTPSGLLPSRKNFWFPLLPPSSIFYFLLPKSPPHHTPKHTATQVTGFFPRACEHAGATQRCLSDKFTQLNSPLSTSTFGTQLVILKYKIT